MVVDIWEPRAAIVPPASVVAEEPASVPAEERAPEMAMAELGVNEVEVEPELTPRERTMDELQFELPASHDISAVETERPPTPTASEPTHPPTEFSEELIERSHRVVEKLSREVIERIAWEVVPDLAELMIKEHVEAQLKESHPR
jgi:hypothetical protein